MLRLTCVPKLARCVLHRHIDADASSLNIPLLYIDCGCYESVLSFCRCSDRWSQYFVDRCLCLTASTSSCSMAGARLAAFSNTSVKDIEIYKNTLHVLFCFELFYMAEYLTRTRHENFHGKFSLCAKYLIRSIGQKLKCR